MLQIYNSLTKQKEEFKPITPGKVTLYACGVTTYDFCHMGNARTLIAFDMVVRYLRYRGFDVKYVRNITDVDDKIIKRVNENREEYYAFVQRYIDIMHEDLKELGAIMPDEEPRATQFMPQIIYLIQRLFEKGYAYVGGNGDVFYDVRHFKNYGKLSCCDLDKMRSGARVETSENKKDPLDFVLWKLAKPNEPSWESPWGKGRPGWHIECSAMSMGTLGETIDIHGGGADLLFPHHENEIAQSESASSKPFVKTWMHAGYLQTNKTKMSKSSDNFFTIRDVLAYFSGEVARYFLLSGHYRSPLNYSEDALKQADQSLESLYIALRDITPTFMPSNTVFEKYFMEAMNDDFNTPQAFSVLFDIAHEINRLRDADMKTAQAHAALLKRLGGVLGLLQQEPSAFLQKTEGVSAGDIDKLIQERNQARAQKDWATADKIRDQLSTQGIVLEDKDGHTVWRKK
ncbi:MAG: cysteine--tRNA ligase [Gammaproteobacteria bacterium RIFCSPHIGHO2_02_FULL_42_13]|nr:MAG: cysteine--tRNA ligase [Gammaproteobacteria bacterium RIFCSPHIGHO2_02_FULL_42_13]OGT69689.1 MAG: cysteine--tRNA ligase [Gammaproteobacteria bacterium RIFCSPLOWO2_02_FULL_42_9]